MITSNEKSLLLFIYNRLTGFYGENQNQDHLKRLKAMISKRDAKTNRSVQQNRYYWGQVVPAIAEMMGEQDHNEVHEILKAKFNLKIKIFNGTEIRFSGDSKTMNTAEFEDYLRKIRMWGDEFGCMIPKPNETWATQ